MQVFCHGSEWQNKVLSFFMSNIWNKMRQTNVSLKRFSFISYTNQQSVETHQSNCWFAVETLSGLFCLKALNWTSNSKYFSVICYVRLSAKARNKKSKTRR